jgi:ergothioneine biosynthesis protein EgtB
MDLAFALPASGSATQRAPESTALSRRYQQVRAFSNQLCQGLAPEDMVVQSMADVSPTKWHLAHTSWFFETFILQPHAAGYHALDPAYAFLFNSYYHQAGERHCRAQRGYISRPTVQQVLEYRDYVDHHMHRFLEQDAAQQPDVVALIELGINHEQQHQELMLTDIKHVFSVNPLRPAYRLHPHTAPGLATAHRWVGFDERVGWIGWNQPGFSYDNEGPRHREFVAAFELGSRLITNGEYLGFMEDRGYQRPELWLSLGWDAVQTNQWTEPFYWERRDGEWQLFTLSGMRKLDPAEPVTHLSFFEADAYARWAGARLPTEAEWEIAACDLPLQGNFVESGNLHPFPAVDGSDLQQMYGDVWEWTRSPYSPYPGFQPAAGAVGEYNGKFMCNQFVLRGGSCATSLTHMRPTYRNFFPADATWQFTGLRLARDL